MKYLGEEQEVTIKTVIKRPIEYVRCDRCGKKIMPNKFNTAENQYVHIHTWHEDWGRDSIESHEYNDYCVYCAKIVINVFIDKLGGTDQLELSNEYLYSKANYINEPRRIDGYDLVINDKENLER